VKFIGQVFRSKFLRFALIGSFGFLVNEAALYLCLHLGHLNKDQGWFAAYLVAVTFTWWGNRTITFREYASDKGLLAEWAAFVVANGVGAFANATVYFSFVHFAPSPASDPLLALAAGALAGMAFNFAAAQRFVFRKKSAQP
jgi:putative flippase GtrA